MALSKNERIKHIEDFKNATRDCVAGALHVFKGALLNSDASGNVKLSTDAAAEFFAGISEDEVEQVAAASAGDNTPRLFSKGSGRTFKMKLTGVTKAQIGLSVYAKADDEVQLVGDATNDVLIGTIVELAGTNYCWVKI